MKKTILTMSLMASMSGLQAATYDVTGAFQIRDPSGMLMLNNTSLTGNMQLDMTTGLGTADIYAPLRFDTITYYLHELNIQITGPSTASANILFDWYATTNIHVTMDMSITVNGDGSIDFITLDGHSADGILGNPIIDGSILQGFNPALILNATTVVPVPASVWLFGSGLIGLVGFARRKKA